MKTFPTCRIWRSKDENRFRDVKKVQEREKGVFCPQKGKKEEEKEEAMSSNWKNKRILKSERTKIMILTQKRPFLWLKKQIILLCNTSTTGKTIFIFYLHFPGIIKVQIHLCTMRTVAAMCCVFDWYRPPDQCCW